MPCWVWSFSISAAVGFIALAGVSVLNSMVLVTFIRQLRAKGFGHVDAITVAALLVLPVLYRLFGPRGVVAEA